LLPAKIQPVKNGVRNYHEDTEKTDSSYSPPRQFKHCLNHVEAFTEDAKLNATSQIRISFTRPENIPVLIVSSVVHNIETFACFLPSLTFVLSLHIVVTIYCLSNAIAALDRI